MKIGLCQLDIVWEDKEQNKAKAKQFIRQASQAGVQLILFPEMSLTGFSMNTGKTGESSRETVQEFQRIASEHGVAVGVGWVENYLGKARNHYTLISLQGETLADYAKIHPFSYSGEDKHFYGGDQLAICRFQEFSIATFICYDLRFPEIFQAASRTADLVIVPANWPERRKNHWRTLLQARAIENQVYIAGINCVGDKGGLSYSGNTMLVDPEGKICEELVDSEGILILDIDKTQVDDYRAIFPVKSDRKIELYKTIL